MRRAGPEHEGPPVGAAAQVADHHLVAGPPVVGGGELLQAPRLGSRRAAWRVDRMNRLSCGPGSVCAYDSRYTSPPGLCAQRDHLPQPDQPARYRAGRRRPRSSPAWPVRTARRLTAAAISRPGPARPGHQPAGRPGPGRSPPGSGRRPRHRAHPWPSAAARPCPPGPGARPRPARDGAALPRPAAAGELPPADRPPPQCPRPEPADHRACRTPRPATRRIRLYGWRPGSRRGRPYRARTG